MTMDASTSRSLPRSLAVKLFSATSLVAAALVLAPGSASAASMTSDCSGLQAALNQAVNGDTITLNQLCTKNNSGASNGQFNLNTASTAQSFTLVGQAGSGAGFDGTGVSSSPLTGSDSSSTLSAMTLRNLVFQNATGRALFLSGNYNVTLDGLTFTNDQGSSGGGAYIYTYAGTGSLAITNSNFNNNTATYSGGALAIFDNAGAGVPISISNDVFASNQVTGSSGCPSCGADGGALHVENYANTVTPLMQTGNTFIGNGVGGTTAGDANGGAETILGLALTSTNDRFTGNTLQAPASGHVAEGAALSIENTGCIAPTAPQHVANNLVIAGNSIADGGTAASAHGALYLGCSEGGSNNLALNNSTISGNIGGGGTAGIWGDPSDKLTLNNAILNGDSDGVELTGFGSGGSATATFSDLCNGSAPFAGSGNICAAPLLANAAGGDVHETPASPTIDAGSNALVPNGLNTDFEGAARIQPRTTGGNPAVDIGADEFDTPAPPKVTQPGPTTNPAPKPPPFNDFTVDGQGNSHNGDIDLTVQLSGPGTLNILGTHSAPGSAAALLAPGHGRIEWGSVDTTYRYGATFGVTLHPNQRGKRLFARHRRFHLPLHVRVWTTFTPTGGKPRTHVITVRLLRGR